MRDGAQTQAITTYKSEDVEIQLSAQILAEAFPATQSLPASKVIQIIGKCQARKLNPFAGDVHIAVFNNEPQIIVSKDFLLKTATAQPTFDGLKAGVIVANKKTGKLIYREGSLVGANSEVLVGGWAEVFDKNRRTPSRAEVSLQEYNQGRALWKTKPATMIRKVALTQALREAYPSLYGGLYEQSEFPEHEDTHMRQKAHTATQRHAERTQTQTRDQQSQETQTSAPATPKDTTEPTRGIEVEPWDEADVTYEEEVDY